MHGRAMHTKFGEKNLKDRSLGCEGWRRVCSTSIRTKLG
jgi:hypothetical protein